MTQSSSTTLHIETVLSISKLMGKIVHMSQRRFMETFRIPVTAFRILRMVHLHEGVSQSAIERFIESDGATITRFAKQLEKDGYIRRVPNPADNRFTDVYLTESGESLLSDIIDRMGKMQHQLYAGISEADLKVVQNALVIMRDNVETAFGAADSAHIACPHIQGDLS